MDSRSITTPQSPTEPEVYDVVIVGGGFAGIGAAVGARQASPNGRILILESESCLGGAGTHRGVYSLCGLYTCTDKPKRVVGSIWDDLKQRLLEVGATYETPTRHRGVFQIFEPEGMKLALDQMMADNNIDVLLHSTVVDAYRSPRGTVHSVTIQNRSGQIKFVGRSFVDCSGDCDLTYHAGASVRYGNHGAINLGSLATRFGGLQSADPTAEMWRDAIIAAKQDDPSLRQKIPKDSSVLIRLPGSGDITTYLASAAYDARDVESVTGAERFGRRQAQEYLKILRKLPRHENMRLVSTGPNFGTRESRHVNAEYQLKEEDLMSGAHFEDCIALCGWGMEWHDRTSENWASTFRLPPKTYSEIPLRSLHSVDTANLWAAGRCVDGDRGAGSAVRVMGTALATGQAAGVAAALYTANEDRSAFADDVRIILRKNGALIDGENIPEGISL